MPTSGIIEAIPDAWEQVPSPAATLVVLSYHLGYGLGRQPWAALDITAVCDFLDQVVEMIVASGADVALLQAVDFASQRTYDVDQLHYLAYALGWGFAARVMTWECRYLPYPVWPYGRPVGRIRAGMGVISRYPLVQNLRQRLSQIATLPGLGTLFWPYHTVQMVDVQCGSQTCRILNVHLEGKQTTRRPLQALVDFVQQVETPTSVLLGVIPAMPADGVATCTASTTPWTPGQMAATLQRLQGLPVIPLPTLRQGVVIGSGMHALDTWTLGLPGLPGESLMVRLRWAFPLAEHNGRTPYNDGTQC